MCFLFVKKRDFKLSFKHECCQWWVWWWWWRTASGCISSSDEASSSQTLIGHKTLISSPSCTWRTFSQNLKPCFLLSGTLDIIFSWYDFVLNDGALLAVSSEPQLLNVFSRDLLEIKNTEIQFRWVFIKTIKCTNL